MPTGREIMERAAILLHDADHVRWTLPELCGWINEAVRAIVLAKPSARSESRVIALEPGTLQRVPQTGAPEPLALLAIRRNIADPDHPEQGGRAVTKTSITALDAQEPNWHDPQTVPFRKEARQFVFDEENPLEYYVYPGNDGSGHVDAVLSVLPSPLSPSGPADAIDSYAGQIGLPEPYSVPLLDYVLYRAQMKDDEAGSGGRAMAHYQQFATALGIKVQVARATSPNARP